VLDLKELPEPADEHDDHDQYSNVSRWAKRAASWGEREARQVSPKPRQRRVFRFEEIVLDLKELPEPADEHDDHDQSLSTRQSFGPDRGVFERFEVG
jgi:hypothetical protein